MSAAEYFQPIDKLQEGWGPANGMSCNPWNQLNSLQLKNKNQIMCINRSHALQFSYITNYVHTKIHALQFSYITNCVHTQKSCFTFFIHEKLCTYTEVML